MKEELSSGQAFRRLPPSERQRYRDIVRELVAFAQEHAIPMCFAPPLVTAEVPLSGGTVATIKLPRTLGKIDGASGCVLRMPTGYYFLTAEHVLRAYEERTREGERLNWQIGRLARLTHSRALHGGTKPTPLTVRSCRTDPRILSSSD